MNFVQCGGTIIDKTLFQKKKNIELRADFFLCARNKVKMSAQTHLPVQNGGLPLCDLVDVLQPPLPLVDLLSDVPHYRQRRRHVSIVAADTKRTQLVPEASGRTESSWRLCRSLREPSRNVT